MPELRRPRCHGPQQSENVTVGHVPSHRGNAFTTMQHAWSGDGLICLIHTSNGGGHLAAASLVPLRHNGVGMVTVGWGWSWWKDHPRRLRRSNKLRSGVARRPRLIACRLRLIHVTAIKRGGLRPISVVGAWRVAFPSQLAKHQASPPPQPTSPPPLFSTPLICIHTTNGNARLLSDNYLLFLSWQSRSRPRASSIKIIPER